MLPDDLTAAAPFAPDAGIRREDPSQAQDAALVAHIVDHHHSYTRRTLPYVVALLAKVAGFHRARNAKLAALCDAGEELADAVEAHQEDEERDLFPALLAGAPVSDAIRRELDRALRHHSELRVLLARIRWLADDFTVPAWGSRSYQALMEELEALEKDVLEHVHVESLVLLPRLTSRVAEAC
jgi:regulator of cell morphogenesis and NO signaling